jgi:predicted methyltransferase MtxX (methanogen marker protein 4)
MKNYRANVHLVSSFSIKVDSLIDEETKEEVVDMNKILGISGNVIFYSISNFVGGFSHFKIDSGCFYTNDNNFLTTKFHEKAERVW